jgi:hypothetical protein
MTGALIPFLSMITLLLVATFAAISASRTESRRRDPDAPVSTLARDGKFGGVAFLVPLAERARRPRTDRVPYRLSPRW